MLALGLGISGLITYKTFQWAIYEEIGAGLACLFLGFAIMAFLAITNYEVIRHARLLYQAEVSALTKKINGASGNGAQLINTESEKQRGPVKAVSEGAKPGAAVTTAYSDDEARKVAQRAIEIAREVKEQSERLGSVQAAATWETVMAEFLEMERYLRRWEETRGYRRDSPAVQSITELERRLEALGNTRRLPEPVKALYLNRQRKYEILIKLKEAVEPYADKYVQTEFNLPAPSKLPSSTAR